MVVGDVMMKIAEVMGKVTEVMRLLLKSWW